MNQWALKHWIAAFLVALFGHAALAYTMNGSKNPEIEKSAGTPVTIVGSLTSFAQSTSAEEIPEQLEELKPTTELTEVSNEPITETKPEPLITSEQKPAELEETAILPVAQPKQLKPEPPKKVKQVKKPKRKIKKKPQKKKIAGKQLAALKKGGGARGKQNKIAGRAAISNYHGRIQSHLARYKRSPGKGARGRTVVSFSISRSGRVASVRLSRRSGNAAIDRAAISMVKRASPFPPIPRGMRARMSFSVPVNYR